MIFGFIRRTIKAAFFVVYKIISFFSLQFALLVALVGLVLYATGVLEDRTALVIFSLVFVISAVYAIISTLRKLLGVGKKIKKSKGVEILPAETPENKGGTEKKEESEKDGGVAESGAASAAREEKPVYYRVRQNPSLIMAEFSDRYELYRTENKKLVKLRTDYK